MIRKMASTKWQRHFLPAAGVVRSRFQSRMPKPYLKHCPKRRLIYRSRRRVYSVICSKTIISACCSTDTTVQSVKTDFFRPAACRICCRMLSKKGNPNAYEEKKRLSQLIGNRGNWYLQLQGLQCLEEEKELPWDTSTHAQRKALLCDIRLRDPQKALEMLCSEWKNESAQHITFHFCI